MSYADQVYMDNCRRILTEGVWDTDRPVRPKWEDGTPAHTVKLFGIVKKLIVDPVIFVLAAFG